MSNRNPRGIRLDRGEHDEELEGTYTVEVHCANCDWAGDVEIPKGIPVPKGLPLEQIARCDECGCYTLIRPADEEEPETEPSQGEEVDAAQERMDQIRRELERVRREQGNRPLPPFTPYRERPPRETPVPDPNVVPRPSEQTSPWGPVTPVTPRPNTGDGFPPGMIWMSTTGQQGEQPNLNGDIFPRDAVSMSSQPLRREHLSDAQVEWLNHIGCNPEEV